MQVAAILVGIFVGMATYFVLYKVLFEDSEAFKKELIDTIWRFPLIVILDWMFNWSPSLRRISLRLIFWCVSGMISSAASFVLVHRLIVK